MECTKPGAVTPESLMTYATGETDTLPATHIALCSACAAQALGYGRVDRVLRSRLYRVDCPSTQVLGELALELLPPDDIITVRAHLALCPHCAGELATLSKALREDPISSGSRLQRVIAKLLPASNWTPAPVGVRGAGASQAQSYEASGISITVTVERDPGEQANRWAVLGMVMDDADDLVLAGAPVRLSHTGLSISTSTVLDEWGNFAFSGVEAGEYSLELDLGDRTIELQGVEAGPG